MVEETSYGTILKTTFLFGFVQVFKAVISIAKNKIAAILIGPEGMGVLGIYQNVVSLIQTGAGLGVNQSAVRDVSDARGKHDSTRLSYIISIVNKIILYTALLGCTLTLLLSYWLSEWTFGDNVHIVAYCVIGLVIGLNIIDETKQAILKGMRQLRALAKAGMIGSVAGLLTTAPLYFFFGINGIVPALLIASIIAVLVSNYYVEKIGYTKIPISFKDVRKDAAPMVKMGIALMIVTFLQYFVSLIINAYIRSKGGLEDVGLYNAGNIIINGYFGVIITALMTDYYPRIAAVNDNNDAIQNELNRQSLVTLVLSCPMFVLFITLLPFFVRLLYSKDFLPSIDFIRWAIYFTLITIVSNQVDMILIAKYKTRIMLIISFIMRTFQVFLSILLYSTWGLAGLGITFLIMGLLHMLVMTSVLYYLYKIHFVRQFVCLAFVVLLLTIFASLVQSFFSGEIYYILCLFLLTLSLVFSLFVSKRLLGMDMLLIIKNRISNRQRNDYAK